MYDPYGCVTFWPLCITHELCDRLTSMSHGLYDLLTYMYESQVMWPFDLYVWVMGGVTFWPLCCLDQSEDIRLLKLEMETGYRNLDKLAMLRDECGLLAWGKDEHPKARSVLMFYIYTFQHLRFNHFLNFIYKIIIFHLLLYFFFEGATN